MKRARSLSCDLASNTRRVPSNGVVRGGRTLETVDVSDEMLCWVDEQPAKPHNGYRSPQDARYAQTRTANETGHSPTRRKTIRH